MRTATLFPAAAAASAVASLHAVPAAVRLPASGGGVAEGRAHGQVAREGGGGSESARRERDRLRSGLRSVHKAATKSSFSFMSSQPEEIHIKHLIA